VPLLGACNGAAALQQAAEARQLATTLQVEFAQAVEASNRAVMSESEPASSASAREAAASRERVKSAKSKLDGLLTDLQYAKEHKILEEFDGKFAAYEVLDAKILDLAFEKSNVKATRLAFGPARQAADAFEGALSQLGVADVKVRALVLEAELAVRELQTLEPPHIAEPDDLTMARMEEQMSKLEASARAALEQLASAIGAAALEPASAALDRFMKTNAEIVTLSRRNTNVRSHELTLGQKRTLAATCNENLRALHEALVARARQPTR
jgi:hypothetical protein